ncbi:MAG TPA: hypothetical protein VKS79_05860 [Gemmataceae bacterium]|nr:hypothetical protein [Gemmataceae bacterium]
MNKIRACLVLFLLVLSSSAFAAEPPKDEAKPKYPRGKWTLSKETTFITEPLDKDGYPDYISALNKRLRADVTPENNANVLIWQALGPHPDKSNLPPEYFKWLGIEAPPEKGDYYIRLQDFLKDERGKRIELNFRHLERAQKRPWQEKDFPELAAWLKANEKPLTLLIDASRRPQYFNPLVPSNPSVSVRGLIGATMPSAHECRQMTNALTARAMLLTEKKAYEEAWQTLLACHRLARMVGRGGCLIEGLVGMGMENLTSLADLAFLDWSGPNATQIEAYLKDLQALPPPASLADKVDLLERMEFLEALLMIDRDGPKVLEEFKGVLDEKLLQGIDWDAAMRYGNEWFDRLTAALSAKEPLSRGAKIKGVYEARANSRFNADWDLEALQKEPPDVRGRHVGQLVARAFFPNCVKIQGLADRSQQFFTNTVIAFALARYQRQHGLYPKQLSELAPKYLPQAPLDIFTGKALIYQPGANGYLFYSVGINGTDDGGRNSEDDPPGDDLRVRMPLP